MANSNRPGFDAWGECFGETWELRYERSFLGRVTVTMVNPESDEEGARYESRFLGSGRITIPGWEKPFRWGGPLLRFYTHWILSPDDVPLLRVAPHFLRGVRKETKVTVHDPAWELSELPRLLLLAWFLKLHKESMRDRAFKRVKGED